MKDDQLKKIVDVDTTDDFLDRPEPRYGPDGHLGKTGQALIDSLRGVEIPKLPPLPID